MVKDRLTKYLRAFAGKIRHMSDEEFQRFDEWFIYNFEPFLRKIAKEEGLNERQTKEFVDLMYKVILAKGEFDGRYDNVLIGDALRRVKRNG